MKDLTWLNLRCDLNDQLELQLKDFLLWKLDDDIGDYINLSLRDELEEQLINQLEKEFENE